MNTNGGRRVLCLGLEPCPPCTCTPRFLCLSFFCARALLRKPIQFRKELRHSCAPQTRKVNLYIGALERGALQALVWVREELAGGSRQPPPEEPPEAQKCSVH